MSDSATAEKQTIILKANGKREAFDVEKLKSSLLRAGAEEGQVEEVTKSVAENLHDGMSTHDIYAHAFKILHNLHEPVAKRYSVRKALMNLGPSGFLFEDLIAEIMKEKGFETLTRQTVLGGCVPHEVDVIAWNPDKLIMVEAKFHNELGTKSDLKVALYVKARIDDLKDNTFNYGNRERKVDEGWLVTNTKFSSTAIHYGVCQNLVMIGWNYPEKGNLQDLINESPRLMDLVLKEGSL
jgi:ATP cone domain/Restriction endonuclease